MQLFQKIEASRVIDELERFLQMVSGIHCNKEEGFYHVFFCQKHPLREEKMTMNAYDWGAIRCHCSIYEKFQRYMDDYGPNPIPKDREEREPESEPQSDSEEEQIEVLEAGTQTEDFVCACSVKAKIKKDSVHIFLQRKQ